LPLSARSVLLLYHPNRSDAQGTKSLLGFLTIITPAFTRTQQSAVTIGRDRWLLG
jgi:hypothetical protein